MICSTPVGPLGSGIGGGVELTLHSLVLGLTELGHDVEVVAPAGSLLVGTVVHQVPGALQPSSQLVGRDAPITMPADPVIAAMWDLVRDHQHRVDLVLNLAYDWLPLHLAPYLHVPVAHLVSMASLSDAMDLAVDRAVTSRPGSVAMHSRAQAATFGDPDRFVTVGSGIAVERYDLRLQPDEPAVLGAVGRISPEKGLDAVAEVSARTGLPVHVFGLMQDRDYWRTVVARHPTAQLVHGGFLPTDELQAAIGGCRAVLMTPTWVEAFGNVAIEAMACGVPVIAYRRGGPAEIVRDGETGFLVAPDDVDALTAAVGRVGELDRGACRSLVEREYSIAAFARRVAEWLDAVVADAVPAIER
ncbi:MAG: glycosyltransferase [Ilumatobacteraceae bacterium]|jgi:UDP-glucose:tetrahydrobiopterin glucosyltransferase|nr:glycosyltransferase [Ilumatobacteraceae bacterium]